MLEKIKALFNKNELTTKQKIFLYLGSVLSVLTLILFLTKFSYVYNDKIAGPEVSVSGFNLISAFFRWDFTNPSFGDIAVPFTYYAKVMTILLAIFSTICFIGVAVGILFSLLTLITKNTKINFVTFNILFCTSIALLITFIFALFMGLTNIIPKYCGGNKACHMRSLIIIPALFCFASAGAHAMFANNEK